jgi:hypothetical protein
MPVRTFVFTANRQPPTANYLLPMTFGRPFIVTLLIASLALAGAGRRWASDLRRAIAGDAGQAQSTESLANMNSYALALLLGGLRGPLVMFLWSTSESQKAEHNLEDFDTKVEWIRLLQPEFDTVHLFQIWNKAYNISVQMSNLANKYSTILDALDYADSVDRQRPDDINIIYAIASTYGDKLGGSHEADYYIKRVRQETRAYRQLTRVTLADSRLDALLAAAHLAGTDEPSVQTDETMHTASVTLDTSVAQAVRPRFTGPDITYTELPKPRPNEQGLRRDRLDPMLDEAGNVLPKLLVPTHSRPPGLGADELWYDGSKLQFLLPYEPFPYGIPPQAIGYNYYLRARALQTVQHQEHIQTSEFVIDSRPALGLELWAAEEAMEGRRAELRLFGMDDSGAREDIQLRAPGAGGTVPASASDNQPDPAAGPRALYHYALASRLYGDASRELAAHIRRFPRSQDTFASHIDDCAGFERLYAADHDFLDGVLHPENRDTAWTSAADQYNRSREAFELDVLRYYTEDQLAAMSFPKNPVTGTRYTRETIGQIPADQLDAAMAAVTAASDAYFRTHYDQYTDDRHDYLSYMARCNARLTTMHRR